MRVIRAMRIYLSCLGARHARLFLPAGMLRNTLHVISGITAGTRARVTVAAKYVDLYAATSRNANVLRSILSRGMDVKVEKRRARLREGLSSRRRRRRSTISLTHQSLSLSLNLFSLVDVAYVNANEAG
jgi:hypothetical protein